MTAEELIARARSQIGRKTVYHMGSGGMVPEAEHPAGEDGACDCSGFVCWALRLCRNTHHPLYLRLNDGWISTDAIVADAHSPTGFFSALPKAKPGCLVVFPRGAAGHKIGHVGIVTVVGGGRPASVVHCSSANFRRTGDAIQETGPEVFDTQRTVWAWYAGMQ